MKDQWILAPVLVQVLLTIVMYIRLAGAKQRAVAANEVDEARRALHDDAWPDYVKQINNNIRNQFEVPVLFYVVTLSLLSLQAAGLTAQALAWIFVLSRIGHGLVHTGSNYVPLRRRIFTLGVLVVLAMTVLCAVRLAQSAFPPGPLAFEARGCRCARLKPRRADAAGTRCRLSSDGAHRLLHRHPLN